MEIKERKSPFTVCNVGAWSMTVVSSVGIIMADRQLMSPQGFAFAFATTLSSFHYSLTALVCLVSNAVGYSASTHVIPLWELILFSVVANASIIAMNFSLILNSPGFFQISRLSMVPVVCVMEWILHGKQFSRGAKMAVVMVIVGVSISTVTDVKVNAKGFLCACVAVLCTSLHQILIGSLQKKYSIGSFELLTKTTPMQALSLLFLCPFIDFYLTGKHLSNYKFSSGAFIFLLLSCSIAVFCKVSLYLCIGRFSASSFQVLGHMKTICVMTLAWLLFDSKLSLKNFLGMALAAMGMIAYTWAVEAEKGATNSKSHRNTKDKISGEVMKPLTSI
ncbi:PREDICTED: UDP-galactose transporter 2-like [Prunus mume]|uniref:UDP-galactose transporter 2-like n=1 Tax=Prunus mume TaxID=102107 RepID=A0ABM0P8M2_PRUMU|nr:PREDICTED: UDP-galactose transporter 2-like [Prunus mume]